MKSKRSKAPLHRSATTKPRDPRVLSSATAAERKALARIEARIKVLLGKKESMAWKIGRLLDEIVKKGLHHAAGARTLEEYCDEHFEQGYSTLQTYRSVATKFTQATVKKHGVTKLNLGVTYIGLTPEHEQPSDLPRMSIRVPTGRGNEIVEVPFAKVTASQLEAAIEHLRKKPSPKDDVLTAWAKRVGPVLQSALAAPKGTYRHAPRVRAYPHPNGQHAVRVDLLGVDLDDLPRIAKALRGVELPVAPRSRSSAAA